MREENEDTCVENRAQLAEIPSLLLSMDPRDWIRVIRLGAMAFSAEHLAGSDCFL